MSNANEPINPVVYETMHENQQNGDVTIVTTRSSSDGLTKREYFAGLAMQALLSSSYCSASEKNACAIKALKHADTLLAELEKGES